MEEPLTRQRDLSAVHFWVVLGNLIPTGTTAFRRPSHTENGIFTQLCSRPRSSAEHRHLHFRNSHEVCYKSSTTSSPRVFYFFHKAFWVRGEWGRDRTESPSQRDQRTKPHLFSAAWLVPGSSVAGNELMRSTLGAKKAFCGVLGTTTSPAFSQFICAIEFHLPSLSTPSCLMELSAFLHPAL